MTKRYRNVQGVDVVQRVFKAMPRESAERVAKALNQGGDEIAERARITVPIGRYAGGGDLRESIEVRRSEIAERKSGGSVFVSVVAGTDRATASYARVIEFGRRASADGHPGFPGTDFFFSAYWSVRDRVRGRVKRAIRAAAKAMKNVGQQ